MSGNLERRIGRISSIYQARGRATCKPWHTTAVVIVDPSAGPGTADTLDLSPLPTRCPDWGRRTPPITRTVIIAPEFDEDAEVPT